MKVVRGATAMSNGTLVAAFGAYSASQALDAFLTDIGLLMFAAGVCLFVWGVVTRG